MHSAASLTRPSPFASRAARAPAVLASALSILLVLSVSNVLAQDETVTVRGTVSDTTGAVLPEARIELLSQGGRRLLTRSDERGEFRIDEVAPGLYMARVARDGFDDAVEQLSIEPAMSSLLFQLRVGSLSEDVRITASRSLAPVTALPNTVTVVDRDALDAQTTIRNGTLSGVLEMTVPGFGPSLGKMVGRGESLRGRNPLYTINGVPQHNPLRDGQRDGHTIELDFVERVEVVHGSNAIQGIGATGGVVNLVTKSPRSDGRLTQDVKLSLSTHDSFDANGFSPKLSYLASKRAGRVDLLGGVSIQRRDLFFDANRHPIGLYPTQGDIMDSTARGFYGRIGVDLDAEQRIEATFNDFRLARHGDYVVERGDRSSTPPTLTTTVPGDPRPLVGTPALNDASTFSFDYRHTGFGGGEAAVQAYYQDFQALYEGGRYGNYFRLTPEGGPFLDQSEIDSRKAGLKATLAFDERRLGGFAPLIGIDVGRDATVQRLARSDREWAPEAKLFNVAPFVQLQRAAGPVALSGGLRLENARLAIDDYTTIAAANAAFVEGGRPTYRALLPNAGLVYTATPGFSVYGSYSQGFTMPDVGRVTRGVNTPGQSVATFLDLQPVVTDNVEVGFDARRGRSSLHMAYYRSTSDFGSRLQANANGIFSVKREATAIDGVDVTGRYEFAPSASAGFTYAWIQGQFDSDGDGAPESDLDGLNVAPNRVNLFLDTELNRWIRARLQSSTLTERTFEGPGTTEDRDFGGFTIVDLLLMLDTGGGMFRVGVENLLDRQYLTYFAQTEPFARTDTIFAGLGRTVTFQFERRF